MLKQDSPLIGINKLPDSAHTIWEIFRVTILVHLRRYSFLFFVNILNNSISFQTKYQLRDCFGLINGIGIRTGFFFKLNKSFFPNPKRHPSDYQSADILYLAGSLNGEEKYVFKLNI